MPELAERLPTASIAESFREVAEWFRDAPSQDESPERLEYTLKSHCAKAGWLLIAAFKREVLPVPKEFHDRIDACIAARSKRHAFDRDEHMTVSSVLAKNLFLELIVEWLMHVDAAIYEVPLWKKAIDKPGPLPDGNFHELRGKFYASDRDDEGKLPLHTKSRGLVRLYGKMYSTEPMAAETFADACTLLAGLVGDGENKMTDTPKADGQTSTDDDGDELINCNQAAKLWPRAAPTWRKLFGDEIQLRGIGKRGAKLCSMRDVARFAQDNDIPRLKSSTQAARSDYLSL